MVLDEMGWGVLGSRRVLVSEGEGEGETGEEREM